MIMAFGDDLVILTILVIISTQNLRARSNFEVLYTLVC